jgi:hypothetical protein
MSSGVKRVTALLQSHSREREGAWTNWQMRCMEKKGTATRMLIKVAALDTFCSATRDAVHVLCCKSRPRRKKKVTFTVTGALLGWLVSICVWKSYIWNS